MDEKKKRNINISFILVILITIIIPIIIATVFSIETNENSFQWRWNYLAYGILLLMAISFIASISLYINGCGNLAEIKKRNRAWGILGLIPIFGIIFLIKLKDKNEPIALKLKNTYFVAIMASLIPVLMLIIVPKYYSFVSLSVSIEQEISNIIENSGFSNEEAKSIIKELKKQRNIEKRFITSIKKINENSAIVATNICDYTCFSENYFMNKKNGKWEYEHSEGIFQ